MRVVGLWAVVAAGVAGAAQGISLRSMMQDKIDAYNANHAQSANGLVLRKKVCKAADPKDEDRLCEAPALSAATDSGNGNGGRARCNDCSQTCHVWGDPHMKPFSSSCSTSVFTEPGEYLFYQTSLNPKQERKTKFAIKVEVEKKSSDIGKKPWITRAWIERGNHGTTGAMALKVSDEFNADMCESGNTSSVHNIVYGWGDADQHKGNANIEVEYFIGCRKKHSVWALEVWVKVKDDAATEVNMSKLPSPFDEFPYTKSTTFWGKDIGACVDWQTYGHLNREPDAEKARNAYFNCGRESTVNTENGRVCECSAECAAYGDPHVNDFAAKARRNVKYSFKMPPINKLTRASSFLYSWQNKFAVMVELDDCELITNVIIYALKPKYIDSMNSCSGSKPKNTDWLDEDSYNTYTYNVEDICSEEASVQSTTRSAITWPNPNGDGHQYFDQDYNGFHAGRQIQISELLYPVSKKANLKQCAKFFSGSEEFNSDVDMGGIKAIMKCHLSNHNTKYFNFCLERTKVTQEFVQASMGASEATNSKSNKMFLDLEMQGRSSGWCATGDFKDGQGSASSMSTSNFQLRTAEQTDLFVLADNTPVN